MKRRCHSAPFWRQRWFLLASLSFLFFIAGGVIYWFMGGNPIFLASNEVEFSALVEDGSAPALSGSASDEATRNRAEEIPTYWGKLKQPQKGDWKQIYQRRILRVLVPYSRTFFYTENGRTRGISADLVAELERYLNKTLNTGHRPLTVLAIPVERDELFSGLLAGYGDIALGNLTVTPQRQSQVDFVATTRNGQNEILIANHNAPVLADERDLAHRMLAVRRSSSYFASIEKLNSRLVKAGRPRAEAWIVPESLEDEDILDMLNAGLMDYAVMDEWKARLWQSVYPDIRLYPQITLRENAQTGWAIRKGSPQLASILAGFRKQVKKQHLLEFKFAEYQQRIARQGAITVDSDWQKVETARQLFLRYGARYGFDHLMLLAQGYQESRLDQQLRSGVGAIGVMQLMPDTGKAMQVGNINELEPNIHAGVKYLRQLHDSYFNEPQISKMDQALFSFAAYNAGPTAINRMRQKSRDRGLDPNRWFGQVEMVTSRELGMEPVRYVRNILKYYVAYRQLFLRKQARSMAKEQMDRDAG